MTFVRSDSVAQDQLRAFVERIERMDEELKAINDDKKEIYAEAKGNGFDTKVLKKVIQIRRQDPNERMEQEALLDLYLAALGMAVAPALDDDEDEARAPALSRAPARVDAHAREAQALASEQRSDAVDWDEISRREYPDDSPVQVYFIEASSLGLIKIGSTGMVGRRVSAIQRAIPVPTALIGVVSGGTKREVELHQKYAAHRVQGEWFSEAIRPEIDLLLAGQTVIEEFPARSGEIAAVEPHSAPAEFSSPATAEAGEAAYTLKVEASPADNQAAVDADLEAQELVEIGAADEAPERVVVAPADPLRSEAVEGNETVTPAPGAPKLKMNPEFFNDPHPGCRRPDFCGGNSNLGLCEVCNAAWHDAERQHSEAAE